jgi:CDP-Glycerol:Poly(glycerophosphate) glycerophosphotransferase
MATDRVDFITSRTHFWSHLEPVHREIARRGVAGMTAFPLPGVDEPTEIAPVMQVEPKRLTVVSATSDMFAAHRAGRRVVLMEHGAGQSYSNRDVSYVGGRGRTKAELVLVPNEQAAARHRKFYDDPPCVMVGCPRVDTLLDIQVVHREEFIPVVGITWHWDAHRISPEARSAWPFIGEAVLDALCTMRDAREISLIGTAHPRIIEAIRPEYERRGIEVVEGNAIFTADVLVADNTSTMYEFAALDRPVVVLDSPTYRPQRHHGLRFWDCAAIGPRVGRRGGELAYRTAVEFALDPDDEQVERRREIMERVFPFRGQATGRAADAIMEIA